TPGDAVDALVERIFVDDDQAGVLDALDVGLQCRRVHRDERVDGVAGREDVGRGKVDLEPRDAGERAGGGADLGGEVGQRADVVADQRAGVGELRSGELHAVAGVAAESDGDGGH